MHLQLPLLWRLRQEDEAWPQTQQRQSQMFFMLRLSQLLQKACPRTAQPRPAWLTRLSHRFPLLAISAAVLGLLTVV